MDLYEKIKELAAQKNISIRQLEEKLGFANATLRRWNKNKPSVDKIQAVADYFGVTVDSLLGRGDDQENDTPEFSTLKRRARNLSQANQRRLLKIMEATFDDIDKGELEEDESEDF
ncbi:MAG: helix-turn-helix domain-containing protein [Lactococcus lactis]